MTASLVPTPPPVPTATRTHRLSTASRLTAAGELRALVAALLRTAGHAQLAESARICTSELVANVCRHTPAKLVHVEVTLADDWVSVYVYDDRPRELPVPLGKPPVSGRAGWGWGWWQRLRTSGVSASMAVRSRTRKRCGSRWSRVDGGCRDPPDGAPSPAANPEITATAPTPREAECGAEGGISRTGGRIGPSAR